MTSKWRIALRLCVLLHFLLFSLLGVWRHWGYLTSPYDLGAFDQAIWTASQGGTLLNSFNGSGHTLNWLGIHFQPILYLFVPLYWLYPSVHWLTLSQAAALALTALPIFAVAAEVSQSEKQAFQWALIYLLNPFVIAADAWDFHEVSLAALLSGIGLYAIVKKRLALLSLTCLLLLACKEHFGLAVAGLGVVYGIEHQNWRLGAGFAAVGLIAMVLIIGVIMPAYSPTGQHLMIKPAVNMHPSALRYAWLGNSAASVIKNILLHPLVTLETVFVTMNGWRYLGALLAPMLLLPALAPLWLIPTVGDLLANLLSAVSMPRLMASYHSAAVIPLLTVAAIHGIEKIPHFLKRFSTSVLLKSILLLNMVLAYWVAPLPLPGSWNYWQPAYLTASYDVRETTVKELLKYRPVSIQPNLAAHFTQTNPFYFFPELKDDADFVVLRLESPTAKLVPATPGEFGTLDQVLQMPPMSYLNAVENLLNNPYYRVVYWNDPWLIFEKAITDSSADLQSVRTKIQALRREWLIVKK